MEVQSLGYWKSVIGLNQDLVEWPGGDVGVEILCRVHKFC